MWLIFEAAGRDSGVRGWAYLAITLAMIGGGVAAIFGASAARKRGERSAPRLPYRRRGRDDGGPSRRGRASPGRGLSSTGDRARRGASGALYPQSATAGLNSRPRGRCEGHGFEQSGVDGEVPFGGRPRTRSGPEGSSLKRTRSRAVGQPRRSRRLGAHPHIALRRRVHGHVSLSRARHGERAASTTAIGPRRSPTWWARTTWPGRSATPCARAARPGLPVLGPARHGQDHDRAHPRALPQLPVEPGADRRALRPLRLVPAHRPAGLAGRRRGGRRLQRAPHRRDARVARDRALRAGGEPVPHHDHGRGPPDPGPGGERAAEDARGAAAAPGGDPLHDPPLGHPRARSARACSTTSCASPASPRW